MDNIIWNYMLITVINNFYLHLIFCIIIFVYSIIFFIFLFMLYKYHVKLIFRGITTYEDIKKTYVNQGDYFFLTENNIYENKYTRLKNVICRDEFDKKRKEFFEPEKIYIRKIMPVSINDNNKYEEQTNTNIILDKNNDNNTKQKAPDVKQYNLVRTDSNFQSSIGYLTEKGLFPNQNTQSENNIYVNTEVIELDKNINIDNDINTNNNLNNKFITVQPTFDRTNNNMPSDYNYVAGSSIYTRETKEVNKIKPIPLNLKAIENKNIPSDTVMSNDENSNNVIEIATSVRTKTSQEESNYEVNFEKINVVKEIESHITED